LGKNADIPVIVGLKYRGELHLMFEDDDWDDYEDSEDEDED